jgi:pimeloyl-ACP methyl ester carboxylesterase
MGYVLSDDAAIYYEESGGGHPLILLPGLLGTVENTWRRFVPEFAQHFHTVVVDLRGHGKTNNPAGTLSIGRLVRDLENLIETLGFERVHLCGYSLGGYVGMAYGIRNAGRIDALLMHGTKFFWTQEVMKKGAADLDVEELLRKSPSYVEKLKQDHPTAAGEERWKDLLNTSQDLVMSMVTDGIPVSDLLRAQFPVLVSIGQNDTFVPPLEAEELTRMLPQASVQVVPNAAHAMKTVEKKVFLSMAFGFFSGAGISVPSKPESGKPV